MPFLLYHQFRREVGEVQRQMRSCLAHGDRRRRPRLDHHWRRRINRSIQLTMSSQHAIYQRSPSKVSDRGIKGRTKRSDIDALSQLMSSFHVLPNLLNHSDSLQAESGDAINFVASCLTPNKKVYIIYILYPIVKLSKRVTVDQPCGLGQTREKWSHSP